MAARRTIGFVEGVRSGVLVGAALAVLAAALAVAAPPAAAAVQWTVEKIYTEPTDEIEQVVMRGDHVVWTTYSRTDGSSDLWAYTISTKQTLHLAGPGLAARIDFEEIALDGDYVAWAEYLPGEDTSSIVVYDFATAGIRRLRGSTEDMTWDQKPFIQGDWLVWEGGLEDDRPYWAVDPVVFAYRLSTSGPIKIVRWRDTVTTPYGDDYRSMDGSPVVSNGKVAWLFTRPGGDYFQRTGGSVGVMDLATMAVEWTWDIPDGLFVGPMSFWAGELAFTLVDPGVAPWQTSLRSRAPGAAQPLTIQAPSADTIGSVKVKDGLTVWNSSGKVLYRTAAGGTVQAAADAAGAQTDGVRVVWSSKPDGAVWWRDVAGGQNQAVPGVAGADSPVVDGPRLAWRGDLAGGQKYRGVYLAVQGSAPDFPDVPASHPYAAAVYGMAGKGIISGYASGLFGLTDAVKRAQFAKMICGTMAIPVSETTWQDASRPFTDLGPDDPANLYPHDFVAAAAANNITKGVTPGKFEPYTSITRAQVITMIVRAAENLSPSTLADPAPGYTPSIPNFSDTHWPNLRKAEANGLLAGLQGYGSAWDPWHTATRGEVAQMLWNLLARM